ncbi:MAG: hypothetical protein IJA87_03965 [Clostridia bacterium]|nr:hypothetical protein [Clostridia bacterium]
MFKTYYNEIINVVAQNELLCDLLDKALYKISYELQSELNKNIVTFHHSVSDRIIFEQHPQEINFNVCGNFYHINKNSVLKEYINISSTQRDTICSQDEIMTECLLKEVLKAVRNYCD